jgi:O-methyltransferase
MSTDWTEIKNKLVDIGGNTFNWLSRFFPGVPSHSSEQNIRQGLSHWPDKAVTMIGLDGLDNIELVMNDILANNVEGDILEAGVWRGGAAIFIKKMLQNKNSNKKLYVCDSFEGLPKPQTDRYNNSIEAQDTHYAKNDYLGVSLETVQENFKTYDAIDGNVIFLKGWFHETLNSDQIGRLSLLRMDGDMFSSTQDILNNLYDKVVSGGYIIIDDYGLGCCKEAIHEWFNKKGVNIQAKLKLVNHSIAYFKKD